VTAAGHRQPVPIALADANGIGQIADPSGEIPTVGTLRSASLEVSMGGARELKVWAHTITPDGVSEGLPARVAIHDGDQSDEVDLTVSRGQVVVPITNPVCRLEFVMSESG
jgi:hypothetical protein